MTRFTLDWSTTNVDGLNTVSSFGQTTGFGVATPSSTQGLEWFAATISGQPGLRGNFVLEPVEVTITFDEAVENLAFELFDVDVNLTGDVSGWDDKITIIANDALGNQVPVAFTDLADHHKVTNNVVDTASAVSTGIEASGAADTVGVSIVGPITSLTITYDNDDGPEDSGVVGISNITFSTVELDGYIEGGSGDNFIDTAYDEDPDGDLIDNADAVLPGQSGDADIVITGSGDDDVRVRDDSDTIFGGAGDDYLRGGGTGTIYDQAGNVEIRGGGGADTLFGGTESNTFIGATNNDIVVGGEDDDDDDNDVDVLNLRETGVNFIDCHDFDPESGVVTFLNGNTMTFSEIENVIPCFTPGTAIATPKGEVAVERLKAGDRVLTRDNGIQRINWIGTKRIDFEQLKSVPQLRPILIAKGAIGEDLPDRDMLVSPSHRMLIVSELAQLYFGQSEVLVAAKHMIGMEGVEVASAPYVTYIHFMCDNHEIVLSDGAWSESYQPGDFTLKGFDKDQREELFLLFPALATQEGVAAYGAARQTLKKHEAKLLFTR